MLIIIFATLLFSPKTFLLTKCFLLAMGAFCAVIVMQTRAIFSGVRVIRRSRQVGVRVAASPPLLCTENQNVLLQH